MPCARCLVVERRLGCGTRPTRFSVAVSFATGVDQSKLWLHLLGVRIMRKISSSRRPASNSSERLDNFLLALAFVISRRQMRNRWMSRLRSSGPTPA
jgi:hypothetical protein